MTALDGCSEIILSLNMHVVKWKVSRETVTFIGDMELGKITMCTEQYCRLRGKVPQAVKLLHSKRDFRFSPRSR